ncbi:MAG TPA: hypothetical protein VJS11_05860, partial [Acidobacteriaceae bacterium]|nr:hypothetical protein [Acidobacteriaceae bacterium]
MKRRENMGLLAAALIALLLAVTAVGLVRWHNSLLNRHTNLQQLQDLPAGTRVHLLAQVTYIDARGKRFWVEDETGAAPVPVDPAAAHVHAGENVIVSAVKAGHYDPLQGPASYNLEQVVVKPTSADVKLPLPGVADLDNFPAPEKNGQRVTMQAIVREFQIDPQGYPTLIVGKSGYPVGVIVPPPTGDLTSLVDASVTITGIPEQQRDAQRRIIASNLWVPSWNDVRVESPAPVSVPLRDIRSLYRDPTDGHRVRVRGLVGRVNAGSLLLEDASGAIECQTTGAPAVQVGSAIEATGFPAHDGMRIDLYNAAVSPIDPALLAPSIAPSEPVLTTAQSVRQLSPERAALALPVHVT